jgi:hypothetical protein
LRSKERIWTSEVTGEEVEAAWFMEEMVPRRTVRLTFTSQHMFDLGREISQAAGIVRGPAVDSPSRIFGAHGGLEVILDLC